MKKKMELENIVHVFYSLFEAFHPDELKDDEDIDHRLHLVFDTFLEFSGWGMDEFWEAHDDYMEATDEHICDECKEEEAVAKNEIADKSKAN